MTEKEAAPPEQIGNYRVESLLGRGGMGEVFLGWDDRLKRHVALKRVRPDPPPKKSARTRFRREAWAVARLSHPSIVQVHDLLETTEGDVLVLEYVEGKSLREVMVRGGLELAMALQLGAEIAAGLAEAHGKGLIHRDLKPDNVRVTTSGHAKILDFGLARLLWNEEPDAESLVTALTQEGALVGTVSAMSPEQANGLSVDHRSDLFAFGSLFYQMLTGISPFRGKHVLDTLRRVTTMEPVPLGDLREDLPPELISLVEELLAKSPEGRPANARVVADRLQGFLGTGSVTGVTRPSASVPARSVTPTEPTATATEDLVPKAHGMGKRWAWVLAALVVLATIAGTFSVFRHGPLLNKVEVSRAPVTSIAVLDFQMLNGGTGVDWMRHGIAESLITDFADSPELNVLPSNRLHRILEGINGLDAKPTFEVIRRVAEEGEVGAIVRGSFTQVGDQLEMNARLETPEGEILEAAQARGHPEDYFQLVDMLSAGLVVYFDLGSPELSVESPTLVTTDSVEAWRYYSEGLKLGNASKLEEAELLLRKAVEVDPEFALAYAVLARTQRNLAKIAAATASMQKAVERSERLPLEQRYNIEGQYYAGRWSTLGKAAEAYQSGLVAFPDKANFREQLLLVYASRELYQEASQVVAPLLNNDQLGAYSFYNAAFIDAAADRRASGQRLLTSLARRMPDDWLVQIYLSWYALHWADTDSAAAALDKARQLRPDDAYVSYAEWRLAVLRGDWARADKAANAMATKSDDYARWRGKVSRARNLLFQGRSEAALEELADAASTYGGVDPASAQALCWRAEVFLARGDNEEALSAALQARNIAEGYWPEIQAIFVAAQAYAALGQDEKAESFHRILEERWRASPNPIEARQLHRLAGERALRRGEAEEAVVALRQAAVLLPERGVEIHPYILPDHVHVWTKLGEAELLAGNAEAALGWLERATRAGVERIENPVDWVRAHFLLGRAYRVLSDENAARDAFSRFLDLWSDADLGEDWVREARSAMGQV